MQYFVVIHKATLSKKSVVQLTMVKVLITMKYGNTKSAQSRDKYNFESDG